MTYPLTTTLNRIWACNPCDTGKRRALKAAGKDAPDDEPITYQQIVDAVGFEAALWCCRAEPQYDRMWRLFAVWCARRVQHLMSDQRSIDALDVAERYARGQATDEELAAARVAGWAARACTRDDTRDGTGDAAWAAALAAAPWAAPRDAQRVAFIQLVTTGTLPELVRQEVSS